MIYGKKCNLQKPYFCDIIEDEALCDKNKAQKSKNIFQGGLFICK